MTDRKDISFVPHNSCTGCGACRASCPKHAIVFQDDEEGFPSPVIINEQCVHCGICEKICPAVHPLEKHSIREAYAAQILDKEALKDSTSGGLFTAFSREILNRGGAVFGCVWDEKYNAVIVKAETEEEILPMRASKYVWSNTGESYQEVKKILESGRSVLFTGLPCQADGLRSFLRKDWPNLYILDFFCGGAPSPMAFQAYLKTMTKKISLDQLDFKLRDKQKYGVGVHISYQSPNGRIHQSYVRNPYFFSYHTKVFHRPSCYHCQYRYGQRADDLTMGDYWGVGQYHQEFDIRAGVSALLVNTEKGKELLEAVRDQLQLVPTAVESIAKGNNLDVGSLKRTFHMQPFRQDFLRLCKEGKWKTAEYRYLVLNKSRIKLTLKQHFPKLMKLKRFLKEK